MGNGHRSVRAGLCRPSGNVSALWQGYAAPNDIQERRPEASPREPERSTPRSAIVQRTIGIVDLTQHCA